MADFLVVTIGERLMVENITYKLEEDVRGGRCPLPMLRAKRALSKVEPGEVVLVVSTDPSSHDDFLAMLKHLPHSLKRYAEEKCSIEHYDKEFHFYIEKGAE